jgi:hypothetical protein
LWDPLQPQSRQEPRNLWSQPRLLGREELRDPPRLTGRQAQRGWLKVLAQQKPPERPNPPALPEPLGRMGLTARHQLLPLGPKAPRPSRQPTSLRAKALGPSYQLTPSRAKAPGSSY